MHIFLANNGAELTARCMVKSALRAPGKASAEQLSLGVPLFPDQLIVTLELEQTSMTVRAERLSGTSGGESPAFSEIGEAATSHGRRLLALGFSMDQVVHGYGDLCQSITDLAVERDVPFEVEAFRTLNRGELTVRDVPGSGCTFTSNLPRYRNFAALAEENSGS